MGGASFLYTICAVDEVRDPYIVIFYLFPRLRIVNIAFLRIITTLNANRLMLSPGLKIVQFPRNRKLPFAREQPIILQ